MSAAKHSSKGVVAVSQSILSMSAIISGNEGQGRKPAACLTGKPPSPANCGRPGYEEFET